MGKYAKWFIVASTFIFFLVPILSRVSTIPRNLSAIEVGEFFGNIIGYWIEVFMVILKSLMGR